jgi:hypothetical protein
LLTSSLIYRARCFDIGPGDAWNQSSCSHPRMLPRSSRI